MRSYGDYNKLMLAPSGPIWYYSLTFTLLVHGNDHSLLLTIWTWDVLHLTDYVTLKIKHKCL